MKANKCYDKFIIKKSFISFISLRHNSPNMKSYPPFISQCCPDPRPLRLETNETAVQQPESTSATWVSGSTPALPQATIVMPTMCNYSQGLASYCKAETTFTFHLSNLTLSNASLDINNREIKSESGVSFAIASQPL